MEGAAVSTKARDVRTAEVSNANDEDRNECSAPSRDRGGFPGLFHTHLLGFTPN